jgi:hypothetical protein
MPWEGGQAAARRGVGRRGVGRRGVGRRGVGRRGSARRGSGNGRRGRHRRRHVSLPRPFGALPGRRQPAATPAPPPFGQPPRAAQRRTMRRFARMLSSGKRRSAERMSSTDSGSAPHSSAAATTCSFTVHTALRGEGGREGASCVRRRARCSRGPRPRGASTAVRSLLVRDRPPSGACRAWARRGHRPSPPRSRSSSASDRR